MWLDVRAVSFGAVLCATLALSAVEAAAQDFFFNFTPISGTGSYSLSNVVLTASFNAMTGVYDVSDASAIGATLTGASGSFSLDSEPLSDFGVPFATNYTVTLNSAAGDFVFMPPSPFGFTASVDYSSPAGDALTGTVSVQAVPVPVGGLLSFVVLVLAAAAAAASRSCRARSATRR